MIIARVMQNFTGIPQLRAMGLTTKGFFPAPDDVDPCDLARTDDREGARRWLFHRRALNDFLKSGEVWPTLICEAYPLPESLGEFVKTYESQDMSGLTFFGDPPAKCYLVDEKAAKELVVGPMEEYCDVLAELPLFDIDSTVRSI